MMSRMRDLAARGLRRGVGPLVPTTFKLPFEYGLARLGGCEPELAQLRHMGPNRGVAIDVGANRGLFTYPLARLYERVHAFEISPDLAAKLRQWGSPRLEVHATGLSAREGRATLYTPFFQGRRLDGWASLDPKNCPTAERLEETPVEIRTLDSFHLQGVTFIKADVEGHEPELLAGSRETIRSNRPIVLLEVKDANLPVVREFFSSLGYRETRLKELIGVQGSKENYVFVPSASGAA